MIQKISMANRSVSFAQNTEKKEFISESGKAKVKSYTDSFVKHASDSTPLLLAVAGGWTAYDVVTKKAPFKSAVANNFLGFFAPVLIASSAILSIVENKKTSKSSN